MCGHYGLALESGYLLPVYATCSSHIVHEAGIDLCWILNKIHAALQYKSFDDEIAAKRLADA
jgi:hypothetical protein